MQGGECCSAAGGGVQVFPRPATPTGRGTFGALLVGEQPLPSPPLHRNTPPCVRYKPNRIGYLRMLFAVAVALHRRHALPPPPDYSNPRTTIPAYSNPSSHACPPGASTQPITRNRPLVYRTPNRL